MAREGFSVTVAYASKELTNKQKVALKNVSGALPLDKETENGCCVTIYPAFWAELDIHNEKSDNKDYKNYVIQDKDGAYYKTGSNSFWDSFMDIAEDMAGDDEEWGIEVYKVDSKNYKGKQFLTCRII